MWHLAVALTIDLVLCLAEEALQCCGIELGGYGDARDWRWWYS